MCLGACFLSVVEEVDCFGVVFFIQEGDIFELGGGFCGGVGSGIRSRKFQTGGGMCYGADLAVFE